MLGLLLVQMVVMVPVLWIQYQSDLRRHVMAEQERFLVTARYASAKQLARSDTLLSDGLLGARIVAPDGSTYLAVGQAPPATEAGAEGPPTADRSSLSERDLLQIYPGTHDVVWPVSVADTPMTAFVRLDTSGVVFAITAQAIRVFLFAVLASLLGTLVALAAALRHYVMPLEKLVQAFRHGRTGPDGELPGKLDDLESHDLNLLVQEFNGLIDAQQKAARQVKVKQQYLEFAAHHDPLTHLPNRLMFEDTLKRTVSEARDDGSCFAVFLIDLDNFKFFNDQYGHHIGDKMVAEIANRLRRMMRGNDLVARLDGDEFVVIQKNLHDRNSATEVAKRVMAVANAPFEYRGFTLKSAVSIGISCFPDDVHGDEAGELMGEEIVNNASVALQEAKSCGRAQFQMFNESMRRNLTARIRLEQDLKMALAQDQFEVYYQPKIDIQTRRITGAEALVRWHHPVDGFISPEVFVPVAEEAGLIIELGEWILRTACRQTFELQQMGFCGLNVAVNISAVQFTDGNLLPMVSRALADTRLPPELLELEITESAVMHDPEEVVNSLHELSRFGMRLAIDDFGTGYSSLAYLKRFPVDTLKIDRAFIMDVSCDDDDMAIVEAVLGLGKHFNMKVVAEGVEDEAQLQILRAQGCDLAQGYFIGRPMRLDDYVEWLQRWPHGILQLQSGQPLKLAAGGH